MSTTRDAEADFRAADAKFNAAMEQCRAALAPLTATNEAARETHEYLGRTSGRDVVDVASTDQARVRDIIDAKPDAVPSAFELLRLDAQGAMAKDAKPVEAVVDMRNPQAVMNERQQNGGLLHAERPRTRDAEKKRAVSEAVIDLRNPYAATGTSKEDAR